MSIEETAQPTQPTQTETPNLQAAPDTLIELTQALKLKKKRHVKFLSSDSTNDRRESQTSGATFGAPSGKKLFSLSEKQFN